MIKVQRYHAGTKLILENLRYVPITDDDPRAALSDRTMRETVVLIEGMVMWPVACGHSIFMKFPEVLPE